MDKQNVGNLYENQMNVNQTQSNPTYEDQPYQNHVCANQAYVNQYFQLEQPVKKEESALRIRMKEQFSFFVLISALYAVFYAFCLYQNVWGITYPFFTIGTLCYFFCSMKKLEVPYKKGSLFYLISVVLLGVSNCITTSYELISLNKLAAFLLFFILILHTVYNDTGWDFSYYLVAIFRTIGSAIAAVLSPLTDMSSFFAAKKQENDNKTGTIIYVAIGISIAIPILVLIIALLCSADIVFNSAVKSLISFDLRTICSICLLMFIVFFASYAMICALCKKSVPEEVSDKKIFEPIIGIVFTSLLALVYLCFSMIQILYLFIGRMQLPEGYTYSAYARQGFFQLLFVCILNLILVLTCLKLFRENMILKGILTVISFCTFIMILSSALRMFMYIATYNLTFLRLFVLCALMVIFLLMAGVTAYIYIRRFPLFFYSAAVTTVIYIAFSFAHPDYWIARYNLNPIYNNYQDEYDVMSNFNYLAYLSSDAASVILNEEYNPYLEKFVEIKENREELYGLTNTKEDGYDNGLDLYGEENGDTYEEYHNTKNIRYDNDTEWIYRYHHRICISADEMKIRSFNFSLCLANRRARSL